MVENNKIVSATKWSAFTEIVARLVLPITNMILARLLTPDAFGVVATITMIVSFVEIFTDAGFQKYLIQHEFLSDEDQDKSTCVAFWSNLSLSLILWGIIVIFCEPLATLVGNPGLGFVLAVACVSIPLEAFSSIQMALFKRNLDFKTLFKARLIGIITPLAVTIPLAFLLRSYWSLVIGTIALNVVNAIILTYYSQWKIKKYFSFSKLKEMFAFTVWSLLEALSIWLTSYLDIFIIGVSLSSYYLGIYKTSMTVVGQITALVVSATTPVLFSSLSRLQNDRKSFEKLFFRFQKMVGMLIIPLGIGIFVFRNFITSILLGEQWMEASNFIGLWGLTSAITIVLAHYSSEVYRSLGRPRLSVLAQFLHIIVLCPVMLIAVHYSFETIYIARSFIRLELVLVNLIIMYVLVKISPIKMLYNIMPSLCSSLVMGGVAYYLLEFSENVMWAITDILISIAIYFCMIISFKKERKIILSLKNKLK